MLKKKDVQIQASISTKKEISSDGNRNSNMLTTRVRKFSELKQEMDPNKKRRGS
jgi:hypothetical protein